MLGLLTTILGGWVVGLGFCKIKANSAQLELELGLSLAKFKGLIFIINKKICQITKGILAKITPSLSPNIASQLLFENRTCFVLT